MQKRPPRGQRSLLALSTIAIIAIATSTAEAQPRQLSASEKRIVAEDVVSQLKDPGAAQFRWPSVAFKPGARDWLYCGYVNGKNAFGAYVGFAPFCGTVKIAKGSLVSFSLGKIEPVGDDEYSRDLRRITLNLCRTFGVQM